MGHKTSAVRREAEGKERKIMADRFSRTALLLGDDAINKLKTKHVAVFGLGGVGGYVTEALARSGVGKLPLRTTTSFRNPTSTGRLSP